MPYRLFILKKINMGQTGLVIFIILVVVYIIISKADESN